MADVSLPKLIGLTPLPSTTTSSSRATVNSGNDAADRERFNDLLRRVDYSPRPNTNEPSYGARSAAEIPAPANTNNETSPPTGVPDHASSATPSASESNGDTSDPNAKVSHERLINVRDRTKPRPDYSEDEADAATAAAGTLATLAAVTTEPLKDAKREETTKQPADAAVTKAKLAAETQRAKTDTIAAIQASREGTTRTSESTHELTTATASSPDATATNADISSSVVVDEENKLQSATDAKPSGNSEIVATSRTNIAKRHLDQDTQRELAANTAVQSVTENNPAATDATSSATAKGDVKATSEVPTKKARDSKAALTGDSANPTAGAVNTSGAVASSVASNSVPTSDASSGDSSKPGDDDAKKNSQSIDPTANTKAETKPPTSNLPSNANTAARLGFSLGAKPTESNGGGANGVSEVDRVRFVQRVARAFQAAQDQNGEIRLRLSPASLGALRLEIKVQDGALSAKLQTETETAKSLLLDNLPALRERLAEQKISVTRFEVEVRDQSQGSLPDTLPGNAQPDQRGQTSGDRRGRKPTVPLASAAAAIQSTGRTTTTNDGGRLNVVI